MVEFAKPSFSYHYQPEAQVASQKFKNIESDPRVSFVVDDVAAPAEAVGPDGQLGRGIEVRGHAKVETGPQPLMEGFSRHLLRIFPVRVVAWNIDGPGFHSRNVN